MKRWALVTVVLYFLVSSALVTPPLILLAGQDRSYIWAFYAWVLPALALVQVALLVIPVKIVWGRPVARRAAVVSALICAVPMAVLLLAFVYCVLLMFLGEDGVDPFFPLGPTLAVLVALWIAWGIFFLRGFSGDVPENFTRRVARWLLAGSILELLVAIPAHIISRRREECCAPGFTLFGLATGLSVAILAFGPAVFFLLARRVGEKRRASPPNPSS